MSPLFSGSIPALVTPFRDGKIDKKAFADLIEWQISEGSSALVPVGTTGESPTLSHDEHYEIVELCVKGAAGRVPVIAGAGSNATAEAIDYARHAEKVGADAVLVVTPYYNKPTGEGLYAHFKAVAQSISLPLIIYNIPARSGVDMSIEVMKRLFELNNVVGVKDATHNIDRISLQRHELGKDFIQLSGEDMTALAACAHGAVGCISVTANVAPRLCADLQEACRQGDYRQALAIQDKLTPLHSALFCETSPVPVKYALSRLGRIDPEVRLPLLGITQTARDQVDKALVFAGLIEQD